MRLQLLLCAGLCLGLTAFVGCGHADQESASSTHRTAAPAAQPVRVACVGDSNTAGYGADSYTIALAERLGADYAVSNYGVSGTTAMASGIDPYSETAAYEASLAEQPDIVVLMFGTNDTNRSNWRGRDAFADEYADLVHTYQALDSSPTVLLCTPPAPHLEETAGMVSFGVQPAAYAAVNDSIHALAEEEGLTVVDIYSLTLDHPEWFLDDGIHLANEGAQVVVDAIAEAVEKR